MGLPPIGAVLAARNQTNVAQQNRRRPPSSTHPAPAAPGSMIARPPSEQAQLRTCGSCAAGRDNRRARRRLRQISWKRSPRWRAGGLGWNALRSNQFRQQASCACAKVNSHDGAGAAARRSSRSDLKGKVAVATGASKGIGAAIARSLSTAGAAVVVNYTFSKQELTARSLVSKQTAARPSRSRVTSPSPMTFGGCLPKRKRPSTGSTCR
jgi:short chain dehydrogenase